MYLTNYRWLCDRVVKLAIKDNDVLFFKTSWYKDVISVFISNACYYQVKRFLGEL